VQRRPLPPEARADVRSLMPLHLAPDGNRQRLRDLRTDLKQRGRNLCGKPVAVMTPSESGRGPQIWRCPTARSRRGAIMAAPRTSSASSPSESSGGALAVEEYYDVPSVWPEEGLQRRKGCSAEPRLAKRATKG
jgi:hypothetical protein